MGQYPKGDLKGSSMETSYLKTLELDKIIARAADGCVCKEAPAENAGDPAPVRP